MLDSAVGGAFMTKTVNEAKAILENMIKNFSQSHTERAPLMTHKYRGSQQSSREVKPKSIDSTQGEPKDIYKP
jgi:hypothetical protein